LAADNRLPKNPQERRRWVAESSPRLAEAGLAFLELGRWGEALECLSAAGNSEGIKQLMEQAAETGDLFYWRQAAKALGLPEDEGAAAVVAQTARAAGKLAFASQADPADKQ
jgi:hypothetical protein